MTREELLDIGFQELPHPTVMGSIIYHLKRNQYLSIGCVGTPNEMIFMYERDSENPKKIDDLIVLRNFDYDGYTSLEWIKNFIKLLSCQKK